ncbi:tetratricopeptide repeat protein [candidate division KSB1 bacterium]|nr:tetratricopeptide repeat protein [candidate division KSB1 bacterium]
MRVRIIAALIAVMVAMLGARAATPEETRSKAMDFYIRGTTAATNEDYYRAIFDFQEALRFDSLSAFIHVALAESYLAVGSIAQAEGALDRALALDPRNASALEVLSAIYRGSDRMAQAREALETLVELDPASRNYLRQLLSVELTLKRYDDADRTAARIVGIEGPSDLLLRQVTAVYLNEREYARAVPYLRQLQALDTTDAGIVYTLGTTLLQQGDTAQATALIDRSIRLAPDNPRFWTGRAVMMFDRGEYERALALVDSGLPITGPDAGLYNLRGTALNRLGRKLDAIVALKLAVATDTTMSAPYGTLGLIYDTLDSLSEAEFAYRRAIELSDSAAVYLNNLAYTFAARFMRLDEARVLAAEALRRDPDNASYMDTMGWIEFGQGHHDEALRWLKDAAKRTPGSAEVLEHLGDVYAKRGQESKARDYYGRALRLDPRNERLRAKATP